MSVPASIEKLLKKHNVSYTLANLPMPELPSKVERISPLCQQQVSAHATMLQSVEGDKLLTITPCHTILDLESIKHEMGQPYRPVVGEELKKFTKSLGLESIAALPNLGNLPTIVDRQLLKEDTLLLDIGIKHELIELNNGAFQKLIEATTISHITIPLDTLNSCKTTQEDVAVITESVSSFTELRIKQRLEETLELTPLPAIARKIIALRSDPNADVCGLCEAIELDPGLAAQVVSWAASPYYSAPGSIKSIHDAIVRVLGFDMVLSLALGLALGTTLKMPSRQPDGIVSYWKEAVYVATCTEAIISFMPREKRPSYGCAYLSGLLHNFGFLIIAQVFHAKYEEICQHLEANPHASPQKVEQHIIGVSRNQLACWLGNFWHLPEEVCTALRYQAEPDYNGEHDDYSKLILLTKKLLREKGLCSTTSNEPIPDSVFEQFEITRENAEEAIEIMLESSEVLETMAQQMSV